MPTSRVEELQKALQLKSAEAERISQTFKVEDGGQFVVSSEQAKAFKKVSSEAAEIKSLIDAEQGLIEVKQYLEAPDAPPAAVTHYGQ